MLQQKMNALINDVNKTVCEREELIIMIAVALLSRNNIFILGDTGQAKSYAVNQFRKRIEGSRQFEKLMSKQADEEQLFGRLDLASIIPGNVAIAKLMGNSRYCEIKSEIECLLDRADALTDEDFLVLKQYTEEAEIMRKAIAEQYSGKPEMITTGKIPDSHIVFLDEIFKASEGILNSLLAALNERVWTNEGEVMELPVISFFSASNEIPNFNNPEEKILKPLYDRFQLKVLTKYVEDKDNRLRMLSDKQKGANGNVAQTITLDELYEMQQEVQEVQIPERINELMDSILCELRRRNIAVSDRKYFNFGPIVQAAAWLNHKTAVNEEHMLTLVNYLWNTPQEIEVVKEIVESLCKNPISVELDEITSSAMESYEQFDEANDKQKAINKLRKELLRLYSKTQALKVKASENPAVVSSIEQCVDKLEDFSRKSCEATGFTYVNLAELAKYKF
jgi:MoxR-like ATPase